MLYFAFIIPKKCRSLERWTSALVCTRIIWRLSKIPQSPLLVEVKLLISDHSELPSFSHARRSIHYYRFYKDTGSGWWWGGSQCRKISLKCRQHCLHRTEPQLPIRRTMHLRFFLRLKDTLDTKSRPLPIASMRPRACKV